MEGCREAASMGEISEHLAWVSTKYLAWVSKMGDHKVLRWMSTECQDG